MILYAMMLSIFFSQYIIEVTIYPHKYGIARQKAVAPKWLRTAKFPELTKTHDDMKTLRDLQMASNERVKNLAQRLFQIRDFPFWLRYPLCLQLEKELDGIIKQDKLDEQKYMPKGRFK
jgi:hypothetical protein